jgi:2-polyprenyl-3-methyl-5-hydroxy-6-metoxy-1,4-benzoquinol methylase
MSNPEKFWDFLAANYDAGEGDPSERHDLEIMHQYLQPADTVLELACGTGALAIQIAGWVKEIQAIDISGKMVAAAQHNAAERAVANVHFVHTTLFDASYPEASFDVVMAFNILHLMEDIGSVLARIKALLKPGGVFISSTPCLSEKRSLVNQLLTPLFMVPSKMGIIPYVKMFQAAELEDLLVSGGFKIVETKKFVGGITDYFIVARKVNGRSTSTVEALE